MSQTVGAIIKGWYSKEYHYSRHYSKKFWKRVNAIIDAGVRHEVYEAACRLQNLEQQVIEKLRKAEGRKP